MTAPTQNDPWDVSAVGAMPTGNAPTGNGDGTPQNVDVDIENLGFLNLGGVSVGITPGSHKGKVTNAKVIKRQKNNAPEGTLQLKLVLTYQTNDGDSITEYKNLGVEEVNGQMQASEKSDTDRKWLKSRLMNLGVAEQDVDRIKPQQLIGTPVILTVAQNGQYMNVTFVKIDDDARAIGQVTGVANVAAPGNPVGTSSSLNF